MTHGPINVKKFIYIYIYICVCVCVCVCVTDECFTLLVTLLDNVGARVEYVLRNHRNKLIT